FTRQFVGTVGVGVSLSRTVPGNVILPLPLYSVYPTGRASVSDTSRLGRGTLTVSGGVTASPVLDMTTVHVVPCAALFGSAGWRRDRFGVTFTTSSQLSLAPGSSDAFSAIFAGLDTSYLLATTFTGSAGVRGAWQRLGNENLLEPSLIF